MTRYLTIKVTKCTLVLTEQEVLDLLKQEPETWKKAIKRGKSFTRAEQTTDRVRRKVDEYEN